MRRAKAIVRQTQVREGYGTASLARHGEPLMRWRDLLRRSHGLVHMEWPELAECALRAEDRHFRRIVVAPIISDQRSPALGVAGVESSAFFAAHTRTLSPGLDSRKWPFRTTRVGAARGERPSRPPATVSKRCLEEVAYRVLRSRHGERSTRPRRSFEGATSGRFAFLLMPTRLPMGTHCKSCANSHITTWSTLSAQTRRRACFSWRSVLQGRTVTPRQ
jgi:hypothetical protein